MYTKEDDQYKVTTDKYFSKEEMEAKLAHLNSVIPRLTAEKKEIELLLGVKK